MIIQLNDENPALSHRRLKIQGVNLYNNDLTAYSPTLVDFQGSALLVRRGELLSLEDGKVLVKGQFIVSSNKHVLLVQPTEDARAAFSGAVIVPPGTLESFEFLFPEGEVGPEVLAYVYVLEVGLPRA